MRLLLSLFLSCVAGWLSAQPLLTVPGTHSAYDSTAALLLVQAGAGVLNDGHSGIATPLRTFNYVDRPATLRYDSSYLALTDRGDSVFVSFTPLPLIQIFAPDGINQYAKLPGRFTYAEGAVTVVSPIQLRYRGNFSLLYPKKSLDLEFRRRDDPDMTVDVTFPGLREDDDWVLDALYNEPSRVNAYVAHKVWLDWHTLPHRPDEPAAEAGADVVYAEVFLDGGYHGLFLLSEQVDRKQLKLKSYRDGIRGELYKTVDYTEATEFRGVPDSEPAGDRWAGWEVKHPEPEETDWDHLRDLIRLVGQTTDADFRATAGRHFDLDNLADYLLYLNGLNLSDNLGKNAYLGRYDAGEPYFFVPWDLDAGLGNSYDATRIPSADEWIRNRLFDRLISLDVDGFAGRLCERYTELRAGLLRPESLRARVTSAMDHLERSGAYRREEARWPDLLNYSAEQRNFTDSFIVARIDFLDGYVCDLTTSLAGPVAGEPPVLRVFPNPASRELRVAAPERFPSAPYTLYSIDGRRHASGSLPADGKIALPELHPGLYLLRVGPYLGRVVIVR